MALVAVIRIKTVHYNCSKNVKGHHGPGWVQEGTRVGIKLVLVYPRCKIAAVIRVKAVRGCSHKHRKCRHGDYSNRHFVVQLAVRPLENLKTQRNGHGWFSREMGGPYVMTKAWFVVIRS